MYKSQRLSVPKQYVIEMKLSESLASQLRKSTFTLNGEDYEARIVQRFVFCIILKIPAFAGTSFVASIDETQLTDLNFTSINHMYFSF